MRHFPVLLFGILSGIALACLPALAQTTPQKLALPAAPGSHSYNFGAATLTITMPDSRQKGSMSFTVSSPGSQAATLSLPHDPDAHEFPPSVWLAEMDPSNHTPEFLISRFSGGAHCCAVVQILDLIDNKWTVVSGGSWDGDEIVPQDVDHDGEAEIVHGDDRFLYVFSCYACAGTPTRYFKLIEGALADISESPIFKDRDERDLSNFRMGCANHDNGACAAYVAVMDRRGRHEEGWNFMLKNYDRTQDWGLSGCALMDDQGRCTAPILFKTYPDALAALLQRTEEWRP